MGFMKEFREFAVKGNAIDMAVGIVIGAGFGKIVNSLVSDIIMPVVGVLSGSVDFANKFIVLSGNGVYKTVAEAKEAGVPVLSYGVFVNTVVDFVIVAFSVFMMVKLVNHLRRIEEKVGIVAASVLNKDKAE